MSSSRASTTWASASLLCAALLASCSDAAETATPAPVLGHAHSALTDEVWITTGRDSIELVRRAVGAAAQRLEQRDSPTQREEVALRVPRAALADISEAQHQQHHRCGGFILQESEAEAMASLAASDTPQRDQFFLAPQYTIDNASTVEKLLPEAKEPNVLATIRKLSSYRNRFHTSMTGEEAALYLRDTWKALSAGRDDITVELVDHEKTPQPSVKLTLRGTSLPDEIVVMGGHLDSISGRGSATAVAPGADDNASGIASLTEIVRVAVALDYRPARSVVFYGYAAEEIGLVGSAEIAARAKAAGLNVVGVMQLDMTNYTSAPAPYIGIVTDYTSAPLNDFSAKLIEQYVKIPYKKFKCGYACSDHASWNKNGFPATSPHEADMDQGNDQIHTANDTLSLSKDSAAHSMHFVRFGLAFMAELAKGELAVKVSTPVCDATKPCAAGQRCENGACVAELDAGSSVPGQCTSNTDCATDQVCASGRCGATVQPTTGCGATTPCPTGLACVAGACVVPTDAVVTRDAGVSQSDASGGLGADGAVLTPTTTAVSPVLQPDGGEAQGSGSSGCGIAARGQTPSSTWLLFAAALGLRARRRHRGKLRAPTAPHHRTMSTDCNPQE